MLYDDLRLVRALNPAQACRYFLDGFGGPADAACELRGNQSFWRSGYLVQLARNQYSLSVKTHGPFVKKMESINGENQLGAHLNDGVSLVQRTGREYRDIGAKCWRTHAPYKPSSSTTGFWPLFTSPISCV